MLLIFTGFSLLMAGAIAIDWLQGLETWFWERTECTVVSSDSAARPEYGDHLFTVSYSFRWRGVERTGAGYRHGYGGSDSEGEARVLASRHPAGLVTACWVDPDDPGRSALYRANLWRGLFIFLPLLFVAVGVGALRFVRSQSLADRSRAPGGTDVGSHPDGFGSLGSGSQQVPGGALSRGLQAFKKTGAIVGFFGVFFLFGAGFLIPFFVWPALKVVEARSWDEIPCEILESRVRTHPGDDSSTYSIQVLYRYEAGGQEYLSDRYHFLGGSSGGYEGKARVVEKIPAGSTTACFVDPKDPHEAVLQRGFSGEFLFGLIPLVFVLVGVGGAVTVIAGARGARRSAAGPSWLAPPVREQRTEESGPVTLEPAIGPFGKLVGTTFVALIWNGLVSVFVWQLIEGWRTGNRDWFLALFLIPFVAIGLLFASGVPFSVLALANPRPRLRLSRQPIEPGESVQVEWSFRGFARRISELTITLEGFRGKAASDGSSAQGRAEPVAVIEIARRFRGQGLEFGTASFEIPERLPDGAPSNEPTITWKLKVHGDIAYWPDVEEEYTLELIESPSWDWNREGAAPESNA